MHRAKPYPKGSVTTLAWRASLSAFHLERRWIAGGELAAQHLIEQRHRHPAFVRDEAVAKPVHARLLWDSQGRDLSLVGYDDIPMVARCRLRSPRSAVQTSQMGKSRPSRCWRQRSRRQPQRLRHVVFAQELLVRTSTKPRPPPTDKEESR